MIEHPAALVAEVVADRLAHPNTARQAWASQPWWRQSLAHGAPGVALLHIELAAAGRRPWQRAHDWLAFAVGLPVTSGPDSHLHHGAPAVAHALVCAADLVSGVYRQALADLDRTIAADVRRRLAAAHARINRGQLPALAEFDAIRGLAGVGSYLLRRAPNSEELRGILRYLVRLTEPVHHDEAALPGWWVLSAPSGRTTDRFAGGHGNCGIAHGIGGPLALLSLAALAGVTVDGQTTAIGVICEHLDRWRATTGPAWPYWVTRPEPRADHPPVHSGQRPSWCYGTAGLGRAQQLAALVTGDEQRRHIAEETLICALTDPAQRAATVDASLCHGHAGIAHIAAHTAADATPRAAARLRALIPGLLDIIHSEGADPRKTADTLLAAGPGLLEGAAGVALAALTPATNIPPMSGWDTCLLIT